MTNLLQKLGPLYEQRAMYFQKIGLLELDYGVTTKDFVPPGGCKTTF